MLNIGLWVTVWLCICDMCFWLVGPANWKPINLHYSSIKSIWLFSYIYACEILLVIFPLKLAGYKLRNQKVLHGFKESTYQAAVTKGHKNPVAQAKQKSIYFSCNGRQSKQGRWFCTRSFRDSVPYCSASVRDELLKLCVLQNHLEALLKQTTQSTPRVSDLVGLG